MAEDGATLKIRMLRVTGRDATTQWFEYRPSFMSDIIRITWELGTMDVELDAPVTDYLLRAGYAAPIPEGSAPVATPSPVPAPVTSTAINEPAAEPPPPPATPSWLKPSGGTLGKEGSP